MTRSLTRQTFAQCFLAREPMQQPEDGQHKQEGKSNDNNNSPILRPQTTFMKNSAICSMIKIAVRAEFIFTFQQSQHKKFVTQFPISLFTDNFAEFPEHTRPDKSGIKLSYCPVIQIIHILRPVFRTVSIEVYYIADSLIIKLRTRLQRGQYLDETGHSEISLIVERQDMRPYKPDNRRIIRIIAHQRVEGYFSLISIIVFQRPLRIWPLDIIIELR